MTDRPRRKSDAARRANQVIRGRTMLIMLLLGVASFTVLFWKLYDLQINRHDELKAEQTDSMVISASRGTIYDKNGEIMAISYSTETVLLDPGGVQDFVESQEQKIQDAAEEAAEKGAPYTAPEVLDQAYIARGLSRILDVEEETILEHLENTANRYWKVKKKVDQDVADEVRRFINGEIDDEGNQLTTVDEDGNTVLISTGGGAPPLPVGVRRAAHPAPRHLPDAGHQAAVSLRLSGRQCDRVRQCQQYGRLRAGGVL